MRLGIVEHREVGGLWTTDSRKPQARFFINNENKAMHSRSITNSQTLSALRIVLATLALTVLGTAAADEDGHGNVPGSTSTNAPANSSAKVESPDSRFHLNALSLNVYGLAYHPDRKTVHRKNLDNEFNPGLALHYELGNSARGVTFAEVGAYRDSGSNLAQFASLGYQFNLGEHWRIGGALAAFNSKTYNRGVTFLGMIPLVSYDIDGVQLNAVYFPKVGDYNEVAAFGFYVTLPVGRWMQ